MPRKGWSDAPLEWVQIVRGRRPKSEQWPLAPGHSQTRTRQSFQPRQAGSVDAKRGSTPRVPQFLATVVREQVRSDASTKVSRLQAALSSLGVGDVEEERALELALVKAQKQAEEMRWLVRSRSRRSSSRGPRNGCLLQTRKIAWHKLL